MKAITVVDKNWAIGKNGDLLVHLPGDLRYYKEKTIGNVIVVGRKTLDSFPGGKPLPGRTNIVMTRDPEFRRDGCIICHSKDEVMEKLRDYDSERVFIAGGAAVYEQFMDDCSEFYVTKIYGEYDADRFFPNLDAEGLHVTWQSEMQQEKGISYRFMIYSKQLPQSNGNA